MKLRITLLVLAVAVKCFIATVDVFASSNLLQIDDQSIDSTSNDFIFEVNDFTKGENNNVKRQFAKNYLLTKRKINIGFNKLTLEILDDIIKNTDINLDYTKFDRKLCSKFEVLKKCYNDLLNCLFQHILKQKSKNNTLKQCWDININTGNDKCIDEFVNKIIKSDKDFEDKYLSIKNTYQESFNNIGLFSTMQTYVIRQVTSIIKNILRHNSCITKYLKYFLEHIESYFTFDTTTNKNLPGDETFFHNMYLYLLANGDILGKTRNLSYAVISTDNNNMNKFVLLDDTFKHRVKDLLSIKDGKNTKLLFTKKKKNLVDNGNKELLEYWTKHVNTYDTSNIFDVAFLDKMIRNDTHEIAKLVPVYLDVNNGRDIIYDNEFQILYYLFQNAKNIIKNIGCDHNTKTINIKLFTYMDMCPSCWVAWCMCYDALKERYKKLTQNNQIELNISVYSIKPYVISLNHPFMCSYDTFNDEVNEYSNMQYRMLMKENNLQNCGKISSVNELTIEKCDKYCIKQFIDIEDINILQDENKKQTIITNLHNYIKKQKEAKEASLTTIGNKDKFIDAFNDIEIDP
ncbi:MAG: hypothetical protein IJU54_02705 [Alphaproteobacteria bacterium]|nr:hypothetical protein [Alphaproteobacteria bacterium]